MYLDILGKIRKIFEGKIRNLLKSGVKLELFCQNSMMSRSKRGKYPDSKSDILNYRDIGLISHIFY